VDNPTNPPWPDKAWLRRHPYEPDWTGDPDLVTPQHEEYHRGSAPKITSEQAAAILLGDENAVAYIAIETMRANNPTEGVRPGYMPALVKGLKAFAGP